MHQPYYRYPERSYYDLPWVRLHGVKDYYGMARLIDKFDKIKAVFNFSGVLLSQLLDYVKDGITDSYANLTLKNPAHLTKEEKRFIIERFFSVNFERFIKPNKRYLSLYNKKLSPRGKFSSKDIGDLQALFNLCWFHPFTIKEDKSLKKLIAKAKGYTPADKEYIIKKQYDILAKIFPLYNKLVNNARIEITVTPYHHPIMPLIYDTDILRDAPYLKKPLHRFSSPFDCVWHLEKSKEVFKKIFGKDPVGSWPSEGGVSEDILSIYNREKFKWIGADEEILFKSLTTDYVSYDMIKKQRHLIYQPYKFKGVDIFFRDRNLSDAISFIYQGWQDSSLAAKDLLEHCKRTHYHIKDKLKKRAITIIMDGENAWEYYNNNGVDFFETLYKSLERSKHLCTTTPSEFLKGSRTKSLERLVSGSWINGDFGVWIGSQKNNIYWQILRRIKDAIERSDKNKVDLKKIEEYFHLIEGSDWFWWNTFEDVSGEFRKIFLAYVEKIYYLLGKKPPSYLYK